MRDYWELNTESCRTKFLEVQNWAQFDLMKALNVDKTLQGSV